MEQLWFYTTSVARYPAEIYRKLLGGAVWYVLVFVVPVLLVVNLPANVMVRTFSLGMAIYMTLAAVVLLVCSSVTMRFSLRWYRSASS